MKCDVCGVDDPNTQVACSALGAISCVYCQECLQQGVEPYSVLIGNVIDDRNDVGEWAQPIYDASLEKAGKTWDDLKQDIAETIELMTKDSKKEKDGDES